MRAAIGGEQFVERIKAVLSTKALGRQIREVSGGCELKEGMTSYIADFDRQKGDIDLENTYDWPSFP